MKCRRSTNIYAVTKRMIGQWDGDPLFASSSVSAVAVLPPPRLCASSLLLIWSFSIRGTISTSLGKEIQRQMGPLRNVVLMTLVTQGILKRSTLGPDFEKCAKMQTLKKLPKDNPSR